MRAMTVATGRIATRVRESGSGVPALFLHGNLSAGPVWGEQLEILPDGVHGVAPDLRGFGGSEPAPVDATRGLRDFADDLRALVDALGLERVHLVGHSLGAGVVMQLACDAPELARSLTLVAPISPYGFGGTRLDGAPCTPDYAGSGGGAANPELVRLIGEGDRSDGNPLSPVGVIRGLFFPSPDAVRQESEVLDAMLATRVGDDHYPGDLEQSPYWPGVAPGTRGVLNAMSPRYCNLSAFARSGLGVPVLWVRGDSDAIMSDQSMVDLGHLGAIGAVAGWPGEDAYPAQPMVGQMRAVLDRYAALGGSYREEVLESTGHFVFTQRPEGFAALLHEHFASAR